MKKLALLSALLILAVCILTSCSPNIVGTWEYVEESFLGDVKMTYTFNSDGTGSMNLLGVSSDFTYTLEGDVLAITTSVFGIENTDEYTVTVKGGQLTLTEGNSATIYTKVKK